MKTKDKDIPLPLAAQTAARPPTGAFPGDPGRVHPSEGKRMSRSARHLEKIDISLVVLTCNPRALATGVKVNRFRYR
jgi:hypothetical protein